MDKENKQKRKRIKEIKSNLKKELIFWFGEDFEKLATEDFYDLESERIYSFEKNTQNIIVCGSKIKQIFEKALNDERKNFDNK